MHRLTRLVLLGALLGCGARTGLDEPEPDPPEQLPNPLPPTPEPATKPENVNLGACAYTCEGGCTHPGIVFGTRLDTGEQVIPKGVLPGQPLPAGYSCAASLPRGIELSLEAQTNPGFRFVRWVGTSFPCPCTDSPDPICIFTVKERVYCGATYARQ